MTRTRHSASRRGLTMLELVLALGLITLVSALMFMFYNSSLRTREYGSRMINRRQIARVIAMQIAEEIRSTYEFRTGLGPGISGTDRVITLQTVALPDKELFVLRSIKDARLPAECDVRQVQYYLAYDEDETYAYPDGTEASAPLGLVRREIKTPRQLALLENRQESVDLDLVSSEMRYVRFRYFDGIDWVDKWDVGTSPEGAMGNSLPQAVEITIGYTELPPKEEEDPDFQEDSDLVPSEPEPYSPETYTVSIRLPQADAFYGSRAGRVIGGLGGGRSRLSGSGE